MRRSLLLWVILMAIVLPCWAVEDWKLQPITQYNGHEASAVSAILTFNKDIPVRHIVDLALPASICMESLSTMDGIARPPIQYAELKSFTGADFSHALVTFEAAAGLEFTLEQLRALPGVESAEPNYVLYTMGTANDPYFGQQDNFDQINVPDAWDVTQGKGALVAVIDTGYRLTGMTDSVVNLLQGYDFWGGDSSVQDFIGHGTHVSNTIAEATNNGAGAAGIAYRATVLPCKVFPDYDSGAYSSDIVDAINWAVDQGAAVINMSLGGGDFIAASNSAVANAVDNDTIVFAASGNDGLGSVSYPAAYSDSIAVGATRTRTNPSANPARASFSNYGSALDIAAPGTGIIQETWSSWSGQGYYAYDGTSSACPHAAGVAALLVARRGADASRIREAMEETARNPSGSWTQELGWGEIDAAAALEAYAGSENESPVAVAEAYPGAGSPPLSVDFDGSASYDPDGDIQQFRWIEEGGKILSKESQFTYTFQNSGIFTITLKVIDDEGSSSTDDVQITVSQAADNDPCYQMLRTVYGGCNLELLGPDDVFLDYSSASEQCSAEEDTDPWACLIECANDSDVDSCDSFRSCGQDQCGVEMKNTSGKDDGSDDSGCGFCG